MVTMFTLDSITVQYDGRPAVDRVSLSISPGEVLALIGPNGAGKTSLIRAASGVVPLTAGKVGYQGQDITHWPEGRRARLISVVPQANNFGGAFTVAHTVMIGRTPYLGWLGTPSPKDRQIVQQVLQRTHLTTYAHRRVAELSGGEQQRVLVARALAQDTPVMLLDEPTNHLDLKHQAELLNLIRTLARDKHIAILMALHDLNQVSIFADRVALLAAGKLVKAGPPDEVLTKSLIQTAYQTEVQVINHPSSGNPLVFPHTVPGGSDDRRIPAQDAD